MTFQKIASELAKREGKKSQSRIGDIRELLKALVDWDVETMLDNYTSLGKTPLSALFAMSEKRAAKKRGRK